MGAGSPTVSQPDRVEGSPGTAFPAADAVHVWVADVQPEAPDASRLVAATTDAERERASRFWRREDGDRYLSAHGALRIVLAHYLGCEPPALRFETGEHGKPFLEGSPIEFNLSHSGDVALIAVASRRRVGVDVERLRAVVDLDDLAPRVCSPAEVSALAALAEPHRANAFLAMWTRKEALAKATGEGIGAVMRDGRESAVDAGDRWTLIEIDELPGYAACVAAEGAALRLVRQHVTAVTGRR